MPSGFGLGLEHFLPNLLYAGMWVAFLASLRRPYLGLYYVIPILPWQTVRFNLHSYFLGKSLIDIVLLGVFLGLCLHKEGRIFPRTTLDKVLIIFVVFYYLSLWQGAVFLGGPFPYSLSDPRFSDWKNYAEMPLIFFLTLAAIRTPKQMKTLIFLMCMATLLVNHSYHNMMKDRDFSHFSYGLRDAGVLGYAGENGMAAFQAQFSLFVIGLLLWAKKWYWKLGMLGILVTCMYSLLYTFSRGGYVGLLLGVTFLGIVKKRSLLILVAALLLSWQTLVPGAVRERVLMTYSDTGELDPSAQTRVDLWEDAAQIIRGNPLIGTGYDTYSFMNRLGYRDTHNLYVKVMLETGVVGLALLLAMFFKFFRLGYSLSKFHDDPFLASVGLGVAAFMVCAVVTNMFGDRWTYIQVNGYLWALLGCAARGNLVRSERVALSEAAPDEHLEDQVPMVLAHAE